MKFLPLILLIFLAGCENGGGKTPDLPLKLTTAIDWTAQRYDISELLFRIVPDDQYCMSVSTQKVVSVRLVCVENRSVARLGCTIVCELAHTQGAGEDGCVAARDTCLDRYL